MSARGFIDEIFSRPQSGMLTHERCITDAQLNKLRALIAEDEDGKAVTEKAHGGFEWRPRGGWTFIFTQNPNGTRRRLERRKAMSLSKTGLLF